MKCLCSKYFRVLLFDEKILNEQSLEKYYLVSEREQDGNNFRVPYSKKYHAYVALFRAFSLLQINK